MHTQPITPQNNPQVSNPTSGNPPWYPPDYPEWLVTESCLYVMWTMMAGSALNKIDKDVTAGFRESVLAAIFAGPEFTSALIRDMALAINAGANDDDIRNYLKGIVDAFVVHQAFALPRSAKFYTAYPEFKEMADRDDPAGDEEIFMGFLAALSERKSAGPEEKSDPVR